MDRLAALRAGPLDDVMLKVLHGRVGTGEEESFVPIVAPAHAERRLAVLADHLKDLRVPLGLTQVMRVDHKSIPYLCVHGVLFRRGVHRKPRCATDRIHRGTHRLPLR